jgi:hypothetical protein
MHTTYRSRGVVMLGFLAVTGIDASWGRCFLGQRGLGVEGFSPALGEDEVGVWEHHECGLVTPPALHGEGGSGSVLVNAGRNLEANDSYRWHDPWNLRGTSIEWATSVG